MLQAVSGGMIQFGGKKELWHTPIFLRRDRGYVIYLHIIERYILREVKLLLMKIDLNEKPELKSKHT